MTAFPLELPETKQSLPALRSDLRLFETANHSDGSPSWTIQDPVANQFYSIGWMEFEILSRWHLDDAEAIATDIGQRTPLHVSEQDVSIVEHFLLEHQLVDLHSSNYTSVLLRRYRATKRGMMSQLIHHYLFFRVPLVRPQAWLKGFYAKNRWIYTRSTLWVVMALTLLGLGLTARDWDRFAAHFVDVLTPSEMLSFALAFAVAKSCHELGHALTATRYGVRVAHMGLAFLVLWPVLYTDTAESWRLKQKHQRLAIASAGMITELALAGLATLAWNLVNEGAVKEALFYLATTSWLLSISINLSPFMRFDGYFCLSDAVNMPNLHQRASAMARVGLRRTLLGWQEAYPESMSASKRRLLIGFAFATWLYRLVLFIGIAVMVYHFFIKAVGIVLFLVEMVWFVAKPIWSEIRVWWQRRQEIKNTRRMWFALLGIVVLVYLFIPMPHQIVAPAYLKSQHSHKFYAPSAAQIVAMPASAGRVTAQQRLFELYDPQLELRRKIASEHAKAIQEQLLGLQGLRNGQEQRYQLEQQYREYQAQQLAALEEQARLKLVSPLAGVLVDLDPTLRPGTWVTSQQLLGEVYDPAHWLVEAFVSQRDLRVLEVGQSVSFYQENLPGKRLHGQIVELGVTPITQLPDPLLSAKYGGSIPVLSAGQVAQPDLIPRSAMYRVVIALQSENHTLSVARGEVHISGKASSFIGDVFDTVMLVLIREISF